MSSDRRRGVDYREGVRSGYGDRRVGPTSRLDLSQLYGPVGEVVRRVDEHTEADPIAVYASLMVALGNVVGRGPYVEVGAARHGTNLFVIIVGNSSKARKGTSWSEALRFVRLVDPRWATTCLTSGIGSGEGLVSVFENRSNESDPPVGQRSEVRAMVLEEEWSRTIAVCRREGSTLSPMLRMAWDGGPMRITTRRNSVSVDEHHVSLVAHVTEAEFEARGRDLDLMNGLMNRFLFISASRSKILPTGGSLVDDDLGDLATQVATAINRARSVGKVSRSEEAARRWSDMYEQMALDDPGGLVGAATARDAPIVLRLSLLFCLLDQSDVVDAGHLDAAFDFWSYCRQSAESVLGTSTGNVTADRIEAAVSSSSGGLTKTGISRVFSGHRDRKELARAVDQLVSQGRIVPKPGPGSGTTYCAPGDAGQFSVGEQRGGDRK